MSQNDLIVLSSTFENWKATRGKGLRKDPFTYFCVENYTKPFVLDDEALMSGITDGGGDGGADAIYFLANGELVTDQTDLTSEQVSSVNVLFFQVKNREAGFSPIEAGKFLDLADDYFDLSTGVTDEMKIKYRPEVLVAIERFKTEYDRISHLLPGLRVDYYYITRGGDVEPDKKVQIVAEKVKRAVREHFSSAEVEFTFVNAKALLEQSRERPRQPYQLAVTERMEAEEGYVGLTTLPAFHAFLTDQEGQLQRQLFDMNVRGWLGANLKVNRSIAGSLERVNGPNFWLLNNGVTIIAQTIGTAGKKRLILHDPQIVNGQQTSRAIFRYFSEGGSREDQREILVRIIRATNADAYDAIVLATNNQNNMPAQSLRAMDEKQRQIDELFRSYDLFYDRKKGFYKDAGKAISKIVSTTELVQAVVTLFLMRPDQARARPGDYWSDDKYDSVFGPLIPLKLYLGCIRIMRQVGASLGEQDLTSLEIRNIRPYVAMVAACSHFQVSRLEENHLLGIEEQMLDEAAIVKSTKSVVKTFNRLGGDDSVAKGPKLLKSVLRSLSKRWPS